MKKVLGVAFAICLFASGFAAAGEGKQADGSPARTGLKMAVILPSLGHEFWNNYLSFVQLGARELGIELTVLNSEDNADKCAKYIEDACSMGIDALIFTPYFDLGHKALRDTKLAGIPVVFTDCYLPDIKPQTSYDNYIAYVGPADFESGYMMGKILIENVEPGPDGKKVVGIVNGTPGSTVAIDRREGLQKALDEAGDSVRVAGEVVGNFVRDRSQDVTESILQGNPDIKGIWAANGGTATGVMAGIRTMGMRPGRDVLVVGMDLNPENVEAVENDELLFDVGGHWLQGAFAMNILNDYLNGFPVPAEARENQLAPIPITKDTVAKFKAAFPAGVPVYDFKQNSRVYNPSASAMPPVLGY
ncbi:MAG: ABC transporter substrate-binding protein [Planctomycetota bacterium]|nr:ABC transporter substrate-binding protein [Planctomycetota bacterium]